jgi:hypothetical protein
MARGVHDLLPADRSTYDLEVRIRTQEVRDIKEKQTSISKLRTWVEECHTNVGSHKIEHMAPKAPIVLSENYLPNL